MGAEDGTWYSLFYKHAGLVSVWFAVCGRACCVHFLPQRSCWCWGKAEYGLGHDEYGFGPFLLVTWHKL